MVAGAATRPHYGGTLRVEMREAFETPEAMAPPAGFVLAAWEAGKRAVYTADENAAGGRPYLDSIEIQLGRPLSDQSTDLELGKADVVELGSNELRRQIATRKVWSSSPVRLMVLVFGPRVEDARVREALALAVDRGAIHSVLLQRQGEISGALLPQWLSGDAFLFTPAFDGARARSLVAALAAPARTISLAVSDASLRPIADRIALNARDAGLVVPVTAQRGTADVRLVEVRTASSDPAGALAETAAELGLAEPARADTPEALYNAERALLDGFRVIPLFHLPLVFGAGPRVRGGPGITRLGEWHFENLWVEGRP
ncbi:MAG: ABC transporter substrate-binding protein [Bryobacteraceae bacterium]